MRTARRLLLAAPMMTVAALAAAVLVPALLGYERYVITSGSMTGTVDKGSLLYAKAVPVAQLRVGDVITYEPPAGSGPGGPVTHRIASSKRDRDGNAVFRTKGDANRSADPWTFVLNQRTQARYVAHVPYLGYAFAVLSLQPWRMLLMGIPAALLSLMVLSGLWREAGEEARRRSREGIGDGAA